MTRLKKFMIGAMVLMALGLGALVNFSAPALLGHHTTVPVAYADGCDSVPPDPGLDCPPTPTPTPHH